MIGTYFHITAENARIVTGDLWSQVRGDDGTSMYMYDYATNIVRGLYESNRN